MDKLLLLGMNGLIWGLIIALIALGLAHNVAALSIVATFGLSLILQESVRTDTRTMS